MSTYDLVAKRLDVEWSAAGARMDALEAGAPARNAKVRIACTDEEMRERDAAMERVIALAKACGFLEAR